MAPTACCVVEHLVSFPSLVCLPRHSDMTLEQHTPFFVDQCKSLFALLLLLVTFDFSTEFSLKTAYSCSLFPITKC